MDQPAASLPRTAHAPSRQYDRGGRTTDPAEIHAPPAPTLAKAPVRLWGLAVPRHMPAPSETELDAVGKLIDVLEGLGVQGAELPSCSEEAFASQVLRGGLLGQFAGTAAQLVDLIASADPETGLVPLERKTVELFVDSLLAALWKLDYPAAVALKPSAAAALGTAPNRIAVLEFLAGEAAAARIIAADSYDPDSAAAALQRVVSSLGVTEAIAAAPDASSALASLEAAVKRIVAGLPADYLGEVLLDPAMLGKDGVALLRQINAHLASDYGTRRALLLQRFEVTLRSFLWSKKVQSEGVRKLRCIALTSTPHFYDTHSRSGAFVCSCIAYCPVLTLLA